jgi:hypothetical protein
MQCTIGNRIFNSADQADLFADFSGKDDLALVMDLSGGSIKDSGKTYTHVQVNIDTVECFCFEEGKPKLADAYVDVSSRVVPRLKAMPLLGVTLDVSSFSVLNPVLVKSKYACLLAACMCLGSSIAL